MTNEQLKKGLELQQNIHRLMDCRWRIADQLHRIADEINLNLDTAINDAVEKVDEKIKYLEAELNAL